jgi:hypothetical protein
MATRGCSAVSRRWRRCRLGPACAGRAGSRRADARPPGQAPAARPRRHRPRRCWATVEQQDQALAHDGLVVGDHHARRRGAGRLAHAFTSSGRRMGASGNSAITAHWPPRGPAARVPFSSRSRSAATRTGNPNHPSTGRGVMVSVSPGHARAAQTVRLRTGHGPETTQEDGTSASVPGLRPAGPAWYRVVPRLRAGKSPGERYGPTRAARNSSQVRRPTARPGARFAPTRTALAALPGSRTGTIGRRFPAARR